MGYNTDRACRLIPDAGRPAGADHLPRAAGRPAPQQEGATVFYRNDYEQLASQLLARHVETLPPGAQPNDQLLARAVQDLAGLPVATFLALSHQDREPWLRSALTELDGRAAQPAEPLPAPEPAPTAAPQPEPAPQPVPTTPAERLVVDLERGTVTLDGQTFDVNSNQALRWVRVLADLDGQWVSAPELTNHDEELEGARPDRLRRHLPEPVLALIDTHRSRGSRLVLPQLP